VVVWLKRKKQGRAKARKGRPSGGWEKEATRSGEKKILNRGNKETKKTGTA